MEPKRLLEDEDLGSVFQAAAADLPNAERLEKIQRSLEGAAGLAGVSLGSIAAAKASKAGMLSWAYWLSLMGGVIVTGGLVGALTQNAVREHSRASSSATSAASPRRGEVLEPSPVAPEGLATIEALEPPEVVSIPTETTLQISPSAAKIGPRDSTAPTPSTAESNPKSPSVVPSLPVPERTEVQTLDDARAALAGNPSQALALCNQHAREFPRGMLIEERERIAIEALVGLGRKDAAKARATRFFANFPNSSYRKRIDRLIGE
jgi:hypothetical protein